MYYDTYNPTSFDAKIFPSNFKTHPFTFETFICKHEKELDDYGIFIKSTILSTVKLNINEVFVFEKEQDGIFYYKRNKCRKSYYYSTCHHVFVPDSLNYLKLIDGCLYEPNSKEAEVHINLYPGPIIDKSKLNIQITGEHRLNDPNTFDVNFSFKNNPATKEICYPYFCQVIDSYAKYEKIFVDNHDKQIPELFCALAISNPNAKTRNDFFLYLNSQYKKVNSYGRAFNNMNKHYNYHWSDDRQIELFSKHKFVLCFENERNDGDYYITEKIINAKTSGAIPIYWGSSKCLELFEKDSFLFLEGVTKEDFEKLLSKIKEIDQNDEKYLEMRKKRLINPINIANMRREHLKQFCNKT